MDKTRTIDRLLQWAADQGMNQVALARAMGVGAAHITNWKSRGMPPEHNAKAARIFKRSVDELLGIEAENYPRSAAGGTIKHTKKIPVVGTAQLGNDGYWTETEHAVGTGDGFIEMPSKDKNAYSVRVVGDSMHPRIKSGEFVVVEPNHEIAPGDEVLVVTRDGRSMVKELAFRRDGQVALNSVNNGHARLTLAEDEIEKIHFVAAIAKSVFFTPGD